MESWSRNLLWSIRSLISSAARGRAWLALAPSQNGSVPWLAGWNHYQTLELMEPSNITFFFFFPPCNFVVHRELHKTLKIAACDGNAWCKREVWLPSLLRAHTRRCCGLQNISFYCWIKEWSRISLPDLGNTGSKSVIKCGNIHFWIYKSGILMWLKSTGICLLTHYHQLASVKALQKMRATGELFTVLRIFHHLRSRCDLLWGQHL